ncbi:hypothetical protein ABB02_01561 [Clostridiaceae bacterium JG1575]|nr:hypothetical protein ABB02_01561 [Clostridiaceae bacterium JG1575]
MKKVTVNIQGLDYTLMGEESEEHMRTIGDTVDQLLRTMMRSNRKLNISTAAILTSCNLVDEQMKRAQEAQVQKTHLQDQEQRMRDLEEEIRTLEEALRQKDEELSRQAKKEEALALKKEEDLQKVRSEIGILTESVKEYRSDNEGLSKINKELKFELQSYKYKVVELQNKLFETQMNTIKDKKEGTKPL